MLPSKFRINFEDSVNDITDVMKEIEEMDFGGNFSENNSYFSAEKKIGENSSEVKSPRKTSEQVLENLSPRKTSLLTEICMCTVQCTTVLMSFDYGISLKQNLGKRRKCVMSTRQISTRSIDRRVTMVLVLHSLAHASIESLWLIHIHELTSNEGELEGPRNWSNHGHDETCRIHTNDNELLACEPLMTTDMK